MINGQDIENIRTGGSRYDGNAIEVCINKQWLYRLSSSVILQMVNEFTFDSNMKRVYIHLSNPKRREI